MFSKLIVRCGRNVTNLSHRVFASSFGEDKQARLDPWEDLAQSVRRGQSSMDLQKEEKALGLGSYKNVSKENELSGPNVDVILQDLRARDKMPPASDISCTSKPQLNTELITKYFQTLSVNEICDVLNSNLGTCTPETLAEVEAYLDAVDRLDPHSPEWDSMTSLLQHPDEDRGIRYNFLPRKSSNFEDYIKHSETLQKLVMLGVDLSAVQKFPFIGNHIIRLDFERDIAPKLLFLKDLGVYDHNLGLVLTTNPYILEDPISKLQSVVGYLKSKKFSSDMIGKMVSTHSMFLIMEVADIDSKLGMFQKMFRLTGDQLREISLYNPILISHNRKKIQDAYFLLNRIWEFDHTQLKAMFLKCPMLFAEDPKSTLQVRLEVLYGMEISNKRIAENPGVLLGDHHLVRRRHAFLREIGRAHYDPEKEGYVSLESLAKYTTDKWCWKAGIPKEHYYTFLKTE